MVIPIVVPLYKSYHLLEKFVKSLQLEENIKFHCKFLDNTEKEEFEVHEKFVDDFFISKLGFEKNLFVFLRSSTNGLYSKSVNRLFETFTEEESKAPFFLIFNPDCFPIEKNWLSKFLSIWDNINNISKDKLCTLGSLQYFNESLTSIWHAGCMWKTSEALKCHPLDWNHIQSINFKPSDLGAIPVDGNTGTGLAISIPKFMELGMYDAAKYPHYSSDADFCLRASQKGYSHFCSSVQMIHTPGNSVKK